MLLKQLHKKILTFGVALGLIAASFTHAPHIAAAEQITSFDSQISINQDTSLSITETLKYVTDSNKHGIFRYIPFLYNNGGQKQRLAISVTKVADEKGQRIPFTSTKENGNLTLKIGDPDHTFTGAQTYVISYRVENAINQFPDHDELYWDIVGEGWPFTVMQSKARVQSEFADITQTDCFTGRVGSDDGRCVDSINASNSATFVYDYPIAYGDNMTVAVGLSPENQLLFPTSQEKLAAWLAQNWPILLFPLPTLVLGFLWWTKGRDKQFVSPNVFNLDEDQPQQKKPIRVRDRTPFVYEPLKEITPGEAGALIDEKVDTQDVVAEILQLAHKKFLKIEATKKKSLVIFSKDDYLLTKLKEPDTTLTVPQISLLSLLFVTKDDVSISSLKGTFYASMQLVKKQIEDRLVEQHIYTNKPSSSKGAGFGVGTTLMIAVGGMYLVFLVPYEIFWPIGLLLLQIPIVVLFAINLPSRTARGTNLYLQARGLKETINRGKWREEVKEKQLFIEEVLPYAVALGVVDKLLSDMKDLDIKPPEYISGSTLRAFTTAQFISSFSDSVSSNLSYNPSSSHSGGGSGFSGGSSGGGGGGGGGGSW